MEEELYLRWYRFMEAQVSVLVFVAVFLSMLLASVLTHALISECPAPSCMCGMFRGWWGCGWCEVVGVRFSGWVALWLGGLVPRWFAGCMATQLDAFQPDASSGNQLVLRAKRT